MEGVTSSVDRDKQLLKTRRLSNNSALILVCLLHTKMYGRYGEKAET